MWTTSIYILGTVHLPNTVVLSCQFTQPIWSSHFLQLPHQLLVFWNCCLKLWFLRPEMPLNSSENIRLNTEKLTSEVLTSFLSSNKTSKYHCCQHLVHCQKRAGVSLSPFPLSLQNMACEQSQFIFWVLRISPALLLGLVNLLNQFNIHISCNCHTSF